MPRTIGEVLAGRYTLVRLLGAGGMAEVWLANDDLLRRCVAVKCPLYPATAAVRAMLLQETQASAHLLGHPHIVSVFDLVDDPAGPAIVMEYLDAIDSSSFVLQQLLPHPDASTRTAIALHIALCGTKAIAHAHQHQVIHRDIKPGNILVSTSGQVKLGDFGIAKFSNQATRQFTGKHHATALYLSPEQLHGEPASETTDLYQLGATIYQLLEGKAPYEDEPHEIARILAIVRRQFRTPRAIDGLGFVESLRLQS